MKIIPAKMYGKKASVPVYVDDWDYEFLKGYKWSLRRNTSGREYARTCLPCKNPHRKRKQVFVDMHRAILWRPDGLYVDHINGNSLDNRKENLRIVTRSQNGMNRGKSSNNTSGYKGVMWNRRLERWQARLVVGGKNYYLGSSANPINAAIAHRMATKILCKQYAKK